jgi:hypothetical protein
MTSDPRAELLDSYIDGLKWSEDTPEEARTLVAGNIRGFAGWYDEHRAEPRVDREALARVIQHVFQNDQYAIEEARSLADAILAALEGSAPKERT